MKTCSKCGISLACAMFIAARQNQDGLSGDCKACRSAYKKARRDELASWRLENPSPIFKKKRYPDGTTQGLSPGYVRGLMRASLQIGTDSLLKNPDFVKSYTQTLKLKRAIKQIKKATLKHSKS